MTVLVCRVLCGRPARSPCPVGAAAAGNTTLTLTQAAYRRPHLSCRRRAVPTAPPKDRLRPPIE